MDPPGSLSQPKPCLAQLQEQEPPGPPGCWEQGAGTLHPHGTAGSQACGEAWDEFQHQLVLMSIHSSQLSEGVKFASAPRDAKDAHKTSPALYPFHQPFHSQESSYHHLQEAHIVSQGFCHLEERFCSASHHSPAPNREKTSHPYKPSQGGDNCWGLWGDHKAEPFLQH